VPDAAAVRGVRVLGITATVPGGVRDFEHLVSLFGRVEAERVVKNIGVRSRHVVSSAVCTSDLCLDAGRRLLQALSWSADVDLLIVVTQTPDFFLPATSCVVHGRLGLKKNCASFDINLGCSGYVYGLWMAANLMGPSRRRALLLVGDTISKVLPEADRSVTPLFGDAGTATALEWTRSSTPWHFELGTDGSGEGHLKVAAGAFRERLPAPGKPGLQESSGSEFLRMNGAEVFAFTLREVKPLIERVLANAGWSVAETDAFVFHQANKFMLEHLARQSRIPVDKLVINLESFGNTSSASIPLALVDALGEELSNHSMRLLLAGFGVGFSWGAVAIEAGPMVIPGLKIHEVAPEANA
jgi:3-oxoacyl-[acyl-carrier-protein] synthase-3